MRSAERAASPPTICLAVIARDAEVLLSETLNSARSLVDAMVVLDTGSTDGTVEAARLGGAEVHQTQWEDDFASARNECLAHVRSDWVLWLDAGETLDDMTAVRLRQFVNREADPSKAYLIFVQLAATSPQLSGEQIGQLRLLPARDDLRFVGRIRERVLPSVLTAGLDVDALSCQIHRPIDDHAIARKQAKARRNLRIAGLAEQGEGESATSCMVRAEAHQVLGQSEQAERLYRRTIELAERGSSEMLEAYYGLLTSFDGRPEQSEAQLATCVEALDIFPLDAQLLCGMGSYLLKQGRLDLAARSYEIAATHGQVDPATWHLSDIGEVAVSCLALTLQLQDQPQEARKALEAALAERPESLRLRRQLLELFIKAGDRTSAMAEFDRLPRDLPGREALRSAVRGALLATEKNWLAAEPYLKTAYTAGCRDPLCLRWLTVSYLALGNLPSAEETLQAWRSAEPDSGEWAAYDRALGEQRARGEERARSEDARAAAASPQKRAVTPEKPAKPHAPKNTPQPARGERRVRIDAPTEHPKVDAPAPLRTPSIYPSVSEPPATV